MRAPKRHRPQRRALAVRSAGLPLAAAAARASYVGSPEHKSFPSFAGPPRLRSDASKCDPSFGDPALLTSWLRVAIESGQVSDLWEGEFPRYVWCRQDGQVYEGRLVNQELGHYKGYPLDPTEYPEGLS
jgi:hypothetical protein